MLQNKIHIESREPLTERDRFRGQGHEEIGKRKEKRKKTIIGPTSSTASLFSIFGIPLPIFFPFLSVKTAAKVEKGGIIKSFTASFRFKVDLLLLVGST